MRSESLLLLFASEKERGTGGLPEYGEVSPKVTEGLTDRRAPLSSVSDDHCCFTSFIVLFFRKMNSFGDTFLSIFLAFMNASSLAFAVL